jgi:prevent-host-death family protein
MTTVGVTELKSHLSQYLRRTQAGERFYVTFRGREVAELVPPDPVRAVLWQMGADGEATWSGLDMVLPENRPINTGRRLSDIVLEDRGPYPDDPDPRDG